MLTEKRHEVIIDLLKEKGSITVLELKDILGISESTIRRDLNQMDKEGLLHKVFGGAVSISTAYQPHELSVSQKMNVQSEEKRFIAQRAAELIEPSDFVYLDAGTTTGYMIDFITETNATYVTNAVDHARKLGVAGFHVLLIGGELRGTTEAIVGSQAILSLQDYHFTKGFFGTNAVDATYGFTTPDHSEALVKKTAISQCQDRYALVDSSKFDEVSAVTFAGFDEMTIITNEVPEKYRDRDNFI